MARESRLKPEIIRLWQSGTMNRSQIAKEMRCSKPYVTEVIQKIYQRHERADSDRIRRLENEMSNLRRIVAVLAKSRGVVIEGL